jgi:Tfp pilus assembly protein PilE
MVVVVKVGILAAAAYPSDVDSVMRSKRSDTMRAMLRLQLDQQKIFSNSRFYAGALSTINASTTTAEGLCTLKVTGAGTRC